MASTDDAIADGADVTMSTPPLPRRTTRRRSALRVGLLVTVVAVFAGTLGVGGDVAEAHRNDESYLYLDVGVDQLSGRVEMPYPDLREVFGLDLSGSADDVLDELEDNRDLLQQYALAHTAVGAAGSSWPLEFDGVELLTEGDVGENGLGYAVLPFRVDLDGGPVPQEIEITFTPFLQEIPDRNNVALVSNDWRRGVFEEEANELLVLTPGSPTGTIDLGDASQWRNFATSVELGVDHIRTGPDHIFFVVVLLLPSVLVLVARTWRPAPRLGTAFVRIVLVATMFTLAHSLTFTMAGLDLLPLPPSKLVESLIALSIAAAAVHNIWPFFGQREWAIAFAFGLFHGMGFAGLVGDLDIDQTTRLVSLLGRNVGIEIGQLVIIVMTFPALFVLRRTRLYMPLFVAASLALAALSGLWVVERVLEIDLGFNDTIDRLIRWPRSLVVAIVVTVAAVGYRQLEASRGRLLPIGDPDATPRRPATAPEPPDRSPVQPPPTR